MRKLRTFLENFQTGRVKSYKGIAISLYDFSECYRIYVALKLGEKPETINATVNNILNSCGIKTTTKGIGWRVL